MQYGTVKHVNARPEGLLIHRYNIIDLCFTCDLQAGESRLAGGLLIGKVAQDRFDCTLIKHPDSEHSLNSYDFENITKHLTKYLVQ